MGLFKWMMRTGKNAPGGTSRVMTENYYSLFYEGNHTKESVLALLNFRNMAYHKTIGYGLSENLLDELSEEFYNKIPVIIFCICYFENFFKENQKQLFIKEKNLLFEVILGEYNKLCPSNERIANSSISSSTLDYALAIINQHIY
ncbi:hypothetical protein EC396_04165 [Lutibacter sp. HS1-25]|uniref:hypothetical protein n=1 Tax=Lutibacter sp. HS1-25 TaxID=2485000 RepID=UPI001010A990|nr:hypothetical protein [Lutibacter sp. HS1-25]RXP61396.1 hypothetical protein EC396_04165 [Lutibacter sp. HS1-25]